MYETLSRESFDEFKASSIYNLLTDILKNMVNYMDQSGMKDEYKIYLAEYNQADKDVGYYSSKSEEWKRYDAMGNEYLAKYKKAVKEEKKLANQYHEHIKLANGSIDIYSRSGYVVEVSINSDSLLLRVSVSDFFRKQFSIMYEWDNCVFGIDLDRVPELVEIHEYLLEKIKSLQDSKLYEKDKEEALKIINNDFFRKKLSDICSFFSSFGKGL